MAYHRIQSPKKHPGWLKFTAILIALSLLTVILIYGKFIIMPLAFSAFFAMLMNPIVRFFETKKINRVISILLSLLVVVTVFAGIFSLISAQFIQFSERVPEVTEKLKTVSTNAIIFLEESAGISQEEQSEYMQQGITNLIDQSGNYVSTIVSTTTSFFTLAALLPIFIFFMLYYRVMYQTFFRKLFERGDSSEDIDNILDKIQNVSQNYLVGMLSVIGLLAILNTTGLFLIGLDHALFFGVFASLLAIIPYIGIIIGALPPLLFALLLTDSLLTPLLVIGVFATVQFLEGNFITPRIVGSKVSINPFVAMIALVIGGELWGISGMILFVPFIGILKVIFDQIPTLKPYGYILGNKIEYES